jgi:hypothetical protein
MEWFACKMVFAIVVKAYINILTGGRAIMPIFKPTKSWSEIPRATNPVTKLSFSPSCEGEPVHLNVAADTDPTSGLAQTR